MDRTGEQWTGDDVASRADGDGQAGDASERVNEGGRTAGEASVAGGGKTPAPVRPSEHDGKA